MEEKLIIRIKLFILKRLILSSMQRAKAIISLSATCTNILSNNGIEKNKITTIRNGVDKFWAEKINPQWLFRTKDTKGQPVDYIGQLLEHVNRSKLRV